MRGGSLRHRVTVQAHSEVADGHGGFTESWTTICARVSAFVEPLSGRELDRAMQIDPRSSHQVTMRFRPDVKARHVVIYHDGETDRRFEVVDGPTTIEERRREMTMTCKELT
jgi:SPP1 family predicted phage head-tail adaptor